MDLLESDNGVDLDTKIVDNAWRGAEAYHFFMLAQRQLYEGTCLSFSEYSWFQTFAMLNLITIQQDATYSVYYISVGSSLHVSGVDTHHQEAGTAVITASGID